MKSLLNLAKRFSLLYPLMINIFYRYADKIICVSKGLESEIKEIFKGEFKQQNLHKYIIV